MSDDSYDDGEVTINVSKDDLLRAQREDLVWWRNQYSKVYNECMYLRLALVVMVAFCLWFAWAMWRRA